MVERIIQSDFRSITGRLHPRVVSSGMEKINLRGSGKWRMERMKKRVIGDNSKKSTTIHPRSAIGIAG